MKSIWITTLVSMGFAAGSAAFGLAAGKPREETVELAGGCFWGMEEILRKIPGVLRTEVGYEGGTAPNPTYEDVHAGTTGDAEVVRVVFDPDQLSFEELLRWFFRMHDPTTPDRQGNDIGPSYRSAIFYHTEAQRQTAEAVKAKVDRYGQWGAPDRDPDRQGGPLPAGGGGAPGLPAAVPVRLHLPLPAPGVDPRRLARASKLTAKAQSAQSNPRICQ